MNNIKKMDEFLKENMIPKQPAKKVKCAECGEEVCDKLDFKIGHLYNKHNCKPSVNDYKAKRMLIQYFPPKLKESMQPYAGVHGAVSIVLDDDDLAMFGVDEYTGRLIPKDSEDYDESKIVPELNKLIINGLISFDGHELWYFENDAPTVKHLKKYFDLTRIWD